MSSIADTINSLMSSHLAGFIIGLVSSLFATYIYKYWSKYNAWRDYRSLLGTWVESNNLLEDRPFSICQFTVGKGGILHFEGYSYDNSGHTYYKWWSVALHIDDRSNRISYVYETHKVGEMIKDEGFGCIFLRKFESAADWVIERGYFLDLSEAKAREARMVKFESVAKALKLDLKPSDDSDRKFLIERLLKEKKSPKIQSILGW
ncbi:hypothetical protein QWY82_01015 [Simiduia curdlanivorans]|uniref:Uncharacterized protein n=1 Tax=Simiduia curdlanivorans TaxID=1492769 RepID=A0ABV8V4K8_9GAMM|nr:hypothetical protein [Simiduia curdlanivorans]MDN3637375.1 hypothetical protein [Simiduia curdlanivorans]